MYTLNNKNNDQFTKALLFLECEPEKSPYLVKFIVEKFAKHNFDEIGYGCLQLFEPGILAEISLLNNIKIEDIENFNYESKSSNNLKNLKWMLDNQKYLSSIQKINLAYALNTLSRYGLAKILLNQVDFSTLFDDWKAYYLFCDFCISNRYENDIRSDAIFNQVKNLISENKVSREAILSFSSQYIVWSLKASKIKDNRDFMLSHGKMVAEKIESEIEKGNTVSTNYIILSSWFRALSMVPADQGDKDKTREYMKKAKLYANQIVPTNIFQEYVKANLIKTYYESKIKEYLYLHKNIDIAKESALKMVNIDDKWSISWQQLGEIYIMNKEYKEAIDSYETALNLGGPRQIESLFYIGFSYGQLKEIDKASEIFQQVLDIDNKNVSAAIAGHNLYHNYNLAKDKNIFKKYIENFVNEGLISSERLQNILSEVQYA